MKLEQRNIVITGGTSGIGRELVRALHRDNNVAVIARSTERLERLQREFPGLAVVPADLGRRKDLEAAATSVRERFEKVDLLINNAAVQYEPTFLDDRFDYESIHEEIAINFTAVCALTSLLLPALAHERPAAILNVNSGLSLMPKTSSAVYCATKAAVNVFSQSLRYQLESTNVRVMQAFVPLVDTGMTAGRGDDKLSSEEAANAILAGIGSDIEEHDIGKIRLLRKLIRFAPGIARKIMRRA